MNRFLQILCKPIIYNIEFFVCMYILGIVISIQQEALCIRLLLELYLELYIYCIIICIFPFKIQRIIRGISAIFAYIIAFIDLTSYFTTGTSISPITLQLFLQTNTQEALEAIKAYFSWEIVYLELPLLFLILAHLLLLKCAKTFSVKQQSYFGAFIFIALNISYFTSNSNLYGMYKILIANDFQFQHIIPDTQNNKLTIGFYQPIHRLLYSIKAIYVKTKEIKRLEKKVLKLSQSAIETNIDTCTFKSPNIVLIIGESYNKHHSQLYNYSKQTTPYQLKREKNNELVVFKNVITSWNYTSNSFENMFSLFGYGDKGIWYDYNLFPAIFKKAGYCVNFLSNQFFLNKVEDNNFGDIFLNNKELSEYMFTYRNNRERRYDLELIEDYYNISLSKNTYNLTIFHLIGQHQAYSERSPYSFKKFKPSDYNREDLSTNQKQILADYDNATLYNDFVVDSIIRIFERKDAIIIYSPDHGEMVFDKCSISGRTTSISQNTVFQQYEIPFWIWCSSTYKEKNPDIWEQINKSSERRFMTDNLSHMLIYLAGISHKEYNSSNNLLHPNYNEKRKRMIRGEVDYDSLMFNYH